MPLGGLGTVALIAGGAQAGLGLYQAIKGGSDKAALGSQPQEQIAPELLQNLSMAQRMALQGLPEEQRQQYLQNIQRSGNMGLNALTSRRAGLAGLGGVVQAQNDAYGGLLAKDSQARLSNQLRLGAQNQLIAGEKSRLFRQNTLNPYMMKYNEATNMQGAGLQNIGGAIGTAGSVIAGGMGKKPMGFVGQMGAGTPAYDGVSSIYNTQQPYA